MHLRFQICDIQALQHRVLGRGPSYSGLRLVLEAGLGTLFQLRGQAKPKPSSASGHCSCVCPLLCLRQMMKVFFHIYLRAQYFLSWIWGWTITNGLVKIPLLLVLCKQVTFQLSIILQISLMVGKQVLTSLLYSQAFQTNVYVMKILTSIAFFTHSKCMSSL